ncbi:uncharacterized protein LOC132307464 isoform X2 [Cornus florida]|uniref:uncharacterized protein LOC132307464 isoform X2 n=1 Tax=Cornus florida TaxID=4283 RepID=UPI0028A05856|nr:uncharacterized protein LOC132307464 isoform X2 [Cornus florida]
MAKRADLRWNRRSEDLEQLKDFQDELLDAASMLVKPGGVLVYSTCSIDPEENEERVVAFLIRHPILLTDMYHHILSQNVVSISLTLRSIQLMEPLQLVLFYLLKTKCIIS